MSWEALEEIDRKAREGSESPADFYVVGDGMRASDVIAIGSLWRSKIDLQCGLRTNSIVQICQVHDGTAGQPDDTKITTSCGMKGKITEFLENFESLALPEETYAAWTPTPANLAALPEPIRAHIQSIEEVSDFCCKSGLEHQRDLIWLLALTVGNAVHCGSDFSKEVATKADRITNLVWSEKGITTFNLNEAVLEAMNSFDALREKPEKKLDTSSPHIDR